MKFQTVLGVTFSLILCHTVFAKVPTPPVHQWWLYGDQAATTIALPPSLEYPLGIPIHPETHGANFYPAWKLLDKHGIAPGHKVIVGVIDSSFSIDHPSFKDNLLPNANGTIGYSTLGLGFPIVEGVPAVSTSNTSHGTAMVSLIAANPPLDELPHVAGYGGAYGTKIIPFNIPSSLKNFLALGNVFDILLGNPNARADVINMSFGRDETCYNQAAIDRNAKIKLDDTPGAIFVAAAGNENNDVSKHTPANCKKRR